MESTSSSTTYQQQQQQPPASPSQVRFGQTPPESPKSCMKTSRRLNFAEPSENEAGASTSASCNDNWRNQPDSSYSSSPKSPRKSAKTVMIKSPISGSTTTPTGIIGSNEGPFEEGSGHHHHKSSSSSSSSSTTSNQGQTSSAAQQAAELQFQFHLSQHYETSPVLPNCTSNGSYEEYIKQKKEEEERQRNKSSCDETSFSFETPKRGPNQYDPQLVEIATKFVNEIIEKAKIEVVNRQKAEGKQRSFSTTLVDRGRDLLRLGNGTTSNLFRRAHGTISKWVTNICVRAQNAVKT